MKPLHLVTYYELQILTYYNDSLVRLSFTNGHGELEESALLSPCIASDFITNWKRGELAGSFAIGTILAKDADYKIVSKI